MANLNKAAWIRSQPASMDAAEIVKKAKAQGITLSIAQVYTTRSLAKKRVDARGAKPGRAAGKPAKDSRGGTEHEGLFRRLVIETLGRQRAQEILNELASIGL